MDGKHLKWSGRNTDKDKLRARIWTALEEDGVGLEPIWDSISDFKGAEEAAESLAQMSFWKQAKVIKVNPDRPQRHVRYRALRDGKLLYMPVPELSKDLPFMLLDPKDLTDRGIAFGDAAEMEGALKYGKRVKFTEMLPMDVLVVGSVAASREGGRTGKGAGFADLELGIFMELGLVPEYSKVVTTVSDIQIVSSEEVPIQSHDYPIDYVFTPTEVIQTYNTHSRPLGVQWNVVKPDQFESIPFLRSLKDEIAQLKKSVES